MNKIRTTVIVFSGMLAFGFYDVDMQSLAYGAMGGMGGGMMGSQGATKEESPKPVNASHAKALLKYIKDEHLQCMQCHAISKSMFGPSFASISTSNMHHKDAMVTMSNHIAHGVGRMPPGYANDRQAQALARQILGLTDRSENSDRQ